MKQIERVIRLAFFVLGIALIAVACLSPLLGQYISHCGPTWMRDADSGIGFGTFLSLAFGAIGLAVFGMYLLKEAVE